MNKSTRMFVVGVAVGMILHYSYVNGVQQKSG